MSGPINTGGPAFPEAHSVHNHAFPSSPITRYTPGMTLRDHYAGLAMQGLLARSSPKEEKELPYTEWVSALAFEVADAMLKAREGGVA